MPRTWARRLVLLSGRGETEAEAAERALRGSGADWTILRASWFFQNFSESYFLEPLLAGELALPIENVAEPFVDAEDIADVAVAALTQPGHAGQLYEVTGPRALTFEQAVNEIAQAKFNRDVSSPTARSPVPGQVPRWWGLVLYLFETVLDGATRRWRTAQRALGRPPRDFADYVMRTALPAPGWREPASM
jgi:uncharacterized protein YbjT (DUF2867 family)